MSWVQNLKISDPIWKLAQTASEEVVRRKSSNEGLKNWTKLLHGIDQVKACMYATSMGKVSINEEQLKSIRINDLRFFASTSGVEFRPNGEQTPNIGYMHTFTFQNRLNLTFTHSFPRLSYKWGEEYLNRIVFIIHRFLEGDEKSPLLKDLLN